VPPKEAKRLEKMKGELPDLKELEPRVLVCEWSLKATRF
jgi:hypothetical protein